jgi:hypothetical protein
VKPLTCPSTEFAIPSTMPRLTAAGPERGPAALWTTFRCAAGDGRALTCLSVNEIRRMHAALCRPAHPPERYLHWSAWRRRHVYPYLGAAYRNRTDDLFITRNTPASTGRASCTDSTTERTHCTRRIRCALRPVHDPFQQPARRQG